MYCKVLMTCIRCPCHQTGVTEIEVTEITDLAIAISPDT